MALNSGLQQIELADFIPTNTDRDSLLCGLCMLEDESAEHLFSAAMQGGFFLSSVRNVDMISLQPTFMMFANGF